MQSILLLILGFSLLYFGGELLVKGSVGIALKMRISTLVVGMTIVSFATSSPELFVCIQALYDGSNNIALGNVIGSNIANIALVLGLTAVIFKVNISEQTTSLNYPIMLFASIILGLVLIAFSEVSQITGFIFIFLLLLFSYFLIKESRQASPELNIAENHVVNVGSHAVLFRVVD